MKLHKNLKWQVWVVLSTETDMQFPRELTYLRNRVAISILKANYKAGRKRKKIKEQEELRFANRRAASAGQSAALQCPLLLLLQKWSISVLSLTAPTAPGTRIKHGCHNPPPSKNFPASISSHTHVFNVESITVGKALNCTRHHWNKIPQGNINLQHNCSLKKEHPANYPRI